ncbi:pectin lyase E [Pestalotiopsis fici W106-1]|uniref:pectin lyase n=1 Tax=Pestalotiopsis fici (strain W106-1 / CGMCC3.15140) TaxID=1229662 RepID=W3XPB3_PESFW|nr:pectin lyase E [Pestalotiopsis fici W106-1]ETS87795.1 pectin lyase E [Pestalotiopsis fici W106-1]
MKSAQVFLTLAAALLQPFVAAGTVKRQISSVVSGTPPGFAASVTGGGNATPVYPTTIDALKSYLTSSEPQVIVISGAFNFIGSEGTTTYEACNIYDCTPENGGQALLNTLGGCGSTATYSVAVDTASNGINVQSDKTLVGKNGATLEGKGLRFVNVENIIIQNVAITNLNPKYVWGGDAITLSGTKNIWIDHVTTSLLGRQHYSFGPDSNQGIAISNSFISGETTQSATCDGRSYWGLELVGSDDTITFLRNRVDWTSGRGPALSGTTLFHAINSIFSNTGDHLIEGGLDNGMGLYEGNYFWAVPTPVASGWGGHLFTVPSGTEANCAQYLGRNCAVNNVSNSGAFSYTDTSFLSRFSGSSIPAVVAASEIMSAVVGTAGNTL